VLRIERENGLRLKGENGIMRKKFNTLHKDIEENQAEIQRMEGEHKKLSEVIKNLEKQITDYRKVVSVYALDFLFAVADLGYRFKNETS